MAIVQQEVKRNVALADSLDAAANGALGVAKKYNEAADTIVNLRAQLAMLRGLYVELSSSVGFDESGDSGYVADLQLMDQFDAVFAGCSAITLNAQILRCAEDQEKHTNNAHEFLLKTYKTNEAVRAKNEAE